MPHKIRVLLIGAPAIGKTKLTLKLIEGTTFYQYLPTIGVDRHYYFDETEQCIALYDSGGVKKYHSIVQSYFKTPDIFALTFSLESPGSLESLKSLHNKIKHVNPTATFLLLGLKNFSFNHTDQNIPQLEVENFLSAHNIENYYQCDNNKAKDFIIFNEKISNVFNKKYLKQNTARHQEIYDPLWLNSYPILKKIENVLLSCLLASTKTFFFEFKKYEKKRAVIQILRRYNHDLHSWDAAKYILKDLQSFSQNHQNCFQKILEYLQDKISIEAQKIKPDSYCPPLKMQV